MSVVRCQQKTTLHEMPRTDTHQEPELETIHMLGFGIGKERYGIDLAEAVEVIRDLMMMQACSSTSMTERFVRCNRRNTIVFNLDQCLTIQGEKRTERKPASFFLLDEKIQDCCVGILVPGIPSILEKGYTGTRTGKRRNPRKKTPLRGTVRTTPPGSRRRARTSISIIDLRELVDNCIVHLKYMNSLHYAGN